jgi:type VI protein secretion system component VasF
MDQVRNDVKKICEEMKTSASDSAELSAQYDKVELPLIFFVDFMIKESKLTFAAEWSELGRERKQLAGDEKFFDLLDETLANSSDAAAQRLVIFYTCIGLGFTGVYTGHPEDIRKLMSKISSRISGQIDADAKSHVCPEAYENVDTRDFVEPPGAKLVGIGIALIGLIIVWGIVYILLFKWTSQDVAKSLDRIVQKSSSVSDSTHGSTKN